MVSRMNRVEQMTTEDRTLSNEDLNSNTSGHSLKKSTSVLVLTYSDGVGRSRSGGGDDDSDTRAASHRPSRILKTSLLTAVHPPQRTIVYERPRGETSNPLAKIGEWPVSRLRRPQPRYAEYTAVRREIENRMQFVYSMGRPYLKEAVRDHPVRESKRRVITRLKSGCDIKRNYAKIVNICGSPARPVVELPPLSHPILLAKRRLADEGVRYRQPPLICAPMETAKHFVSNWKRIALLELAEPMFARSIGHVQANSQFYSELHVVRYVATALQRRKIINVCLEPNVVHNIQYMRLRTELNGSDDCDDLVSIDSDKADFISPARSPTIAESLEAVDSDVEEYLPARSRSITCARRRRIQISPSVTIVRARCRRHSDRLAAAEIKNR